MQTMNAKEYAVHSGYPAVTIKNYCKSGIIPCDRIGRTYLIMPELADKVLMDRMNQSMQKNQQAADNEEKVIPITRGKNFDLLDALKKAR